MADVKYACDTFALNTITGNQSLTISGLGWTPKASFLTLVRRSVSDGSPGPNAVISIGATDGIRQWACGIRSEDGLTLSDTSRWGATDECILLNGLSSATDIECNIVSLDLNGITINIGKTNGTAYLVIAEFYGGADLSACANISPALGIQNNSTDINTVGFEPDFIRTGCIGETFADTFGAFGIFNIGYVHNGASLTQVSYSLGEADAKAPSSCHGRIFTNRGTAQFSDTSLVVSWTGEFESFDSLGFTITVRDGSSGGDKVGYLALEANGADWGCGVLDTPTSTTVDWNFTDPGFEPIGFGISSSFLGVVDADRSGSSTFALGYGCFDGTREQSCSIASEDAQTTTDTESRHHSSKFIYFARADGTVYADADTPSFTSGGFDILAANITSMQVSVRKWLWWAMGTGGGASNPKGPLGHPLLGNFGGPI